MEAFVNTGLVAAIVSEELEEPKYLTCPSNAEYILCIDPLDGSSNTDINGAVGMIFGVYRRRSKTGLQSEEDFLRKGSEQMAAGYVMFSASSILVYTTGHGVFGFTLDNSLGEFLLSHKEIRCPSRGRTYSGNLARYHEWNPNIQKFLDYLVENDPGTNRPYSMRYTGALVADLHRCLIEGGIYLYPADAQHRDGKLRLLYECAPLAFVVEHAGGRATSGTTPILGIQAQSIHQRVPLAIGSADDVSVYEKFLREDGG